jgi:hypothetical protein
MKKTIMNKSIFIQGILPMLLLLSLFATVAPVYSNGTSSSNRNIEISVPLGDSPIEWEVNQFEQQVWVILTNAPTLPSSLEEDKHSSLPVPFRIARGVNDATAMMAGVLVQYTNAGGGALIKQEVTACDGMSLNQARFVVSDDGADNMTVSLDLPPGIFYEAGSISAVATSGGLTVAESDISDLNAPVFTITPANLASGNSITLQWDRRNGMTCDAYDLAIAGGTFKDGITVTTALGVTAEVDPTVNTYNLLFAALSLSGAPAITTTVGSTVSSDVTITNGGLGSLGDYVFTIEDGTGTSTTMLATADGTVITPTGTVGTTTTYAIPAAIIAEYGDLDDLFDNSEQMIFTRTYTVLSCDNLSSYRAFWGCPDACMLTAILPQQTNIANGVPDVRLASSNLVSGTNMCDNAITDVTIQNFGTEAQAGAGTAFSILQEINFEFGTNSNVAAVFIDDGTGTFIPLIHVLGDVDLSQLGTAFGGLIDADGDGEFDDLPVGASFTLRAELSYICPTSCTTGPSRLMILRSSYDEQCGDRLTGRSDRPGFRYASANSRGTAVTLTDVSNGEIVPVEICVERDFFGSLFDCPTNELTLNMLVPSGFTLAGVDFLSNFNTNTFSPVVSSGQTTTPEGELITVVGTRESNSFCFQLELAFDCSLFPGGDAEFQSEITYSCDDACSCQERWYCVDLAINAQCIEPCPNGGLTLLGSDFERITYGYASPFDNTLIDPALLTDAQLNIAMPCDTIKGTWPGRLFADANGVDFGNGTFEVSYDLVGGNTVLRPMAGAELRFFDASNGDALTTVNLGAPTSSTAGGRHTLNYDLTTSLANAGQVLEVNDSVLLCAYYYIEKNEDLPTAPEQLIGIETRYFSIGTVGSVVGIGNEATCSIWAGDLRPHQPQPIGDFFADREDEGCLTYNFQAVHRYRLAPQDPYPLEIRPYSIVDSIVFSSTANDVIPTTGFTADLEARGSTLDGYSIFFDLLPYATISSDRRRAVFINDGTWPFADHNGGLGGGYSFRSQMSTSCESLPVGGETTASFHYQSNGYATDVACREEAVNTAGLRVTHSLPILAITDLTGIVSATTEEASWEIQVRNTTTFNGGYTWIALEDVAANGLEVTSVTNTASGVAYPLLPYADGVWVQVTDNLPGAASVGLTVTANLTDCAPDDLRVSMAWNCPAYPDPDPTVSPCQQEEIFLGVSPLDSEVQIQLTAEPVPPFALCSSLDFSVLLNSSQSADLDNPVAALVLPPGLTIDGNITALYPNDGTGTTQTVTYTTSGDTIFVDLESHTDIGADGMPGTTNALAASEREAVVSFSLLTDCDFSSGGSVSILGLGDRPCGAPANNNGIRVVSEDIVVQGADPQYVANLVFGADITPVISCSNQTADIEMTLIGLASNMTSAQDTLTITLSAGLEYAPGTFTNDGGLTFISSTTNASGEAVLTIALPATPVDLSGGAVRIVMSFLFNATEDSGCEVIKVLSAELTNTISGLACASEPGGICGDSKLILGGASTDILLLKPRVTFGTATDACAISDTEVTVAGTLEVSDQDLPTGDNLVVEFFCADAAGMPMGAAIGSFTQAGPIAAGTSVPFSTTIPNSCDPTNGIVAQISNNQNCICSSVMVAIVPLVPVLTITAEASCVDGSAMQVAANTYYVEVSAVTGGNDGPYDVTVAGVTQSFTGTALSFGPFTHSGVGGAVQVVSATDNSATCEATSFYEVPEVLCGINDGGQASGCFCAGPTTDPLVPTSFILAQSEPGTFQAGGTSGQIQKYVLVNDLGFIVAMNLTGLFETPMTGTYTPYAINYRADEDPTVTNFLIPGEPIQPVLDGLNGTGPLAGICFSACNVTDPVMYTTCSCYSVGSTVFTDQDNDGIYELADGEIGIVGIVVQLLDDAGVVIATTTTDANGDYYFGGLDPDMYSLNIPAVSGTYPISSTPTETTDNGEDNDDNGTQASSGDPVTSPTFELGGLDPEPSGAAETGSGGLQDDAADVFGDMTQDFGFFAPVTVGDTTFVDVDMDGTQSTGDLPLANVSVTIYDAATGLPVTLNAEGVAYVATQMTAVNGSYLFENLPPGSYYVEFDISGVTNSEYYDFTTPNVGDDADDSDATPATPDANVALSGTTGTLLSGQSDLTLDAGIACAIIVTVAEPSTICSSQPIDLAQGASITPLSLGGFWSTPDGTGTFTDAGGATMTAPYVFGTATTYVPSAADARRGSVTFILTTNDPATGPCDAVSAMVTIEVLQVDCGSFFWGGQ